MESVTFYEDGFGIWCIPYPMKKEFNQHPEDIAREFRYTWSRVPYLPEGIKLMKYQFVCLELDKEKYFEYCTDRSNKERTSRLNSQISEFKSNLIKGKVND